MKRFQNRLNHRKSLGLLLGLLLVSSLAVSCTTGTDDGGATFTLTVTKAGTGSGTVTSSPAGITCGTDCSESYDSGTGVTLTAAAANGSVFAGWGGGCSGTGTCSVTLTADSTATATFNDISSSLSQLNSEGLELLRNRSILNAKGKFKEAAELAGTQSGGEADTARFFYALTRVAALGFDLLSDGNPNDLNRVADILDRLGCGSAGRDPFNENEELICPDVLPDNSPTGGELQTFLQDVILPELEGATTNLDSVSNSFNRVWIEPLSATTVESDYGDALVFRAGLKGVRAQILILLSYNLDVDIDAEANDELSTVQVRLARNLNFLRPTSTASVNLPQARTLLQGVVDDLIAAADAIQGEPDSQTDDLVNLENTTSDDITQAKADLTTFKNALSGAVTVDDKDTPGDTSDDVILNGDPFFSGSPVIDLRGLLPAFSGDSPTGLFPDPDFGGILVQGQNVNEDLNPINGTADVFEKSGSASNSKVQTLRHKLLK